MSEEEKIEFIATKIIGWLDNGETRMTDTRWFHDNGTIAALKWWNPLEDWNDWKMVEQHFKDQGIVGRDYLDLIYSRIETRYDYPIEYYDITLNDLCDALIGLNKKYASMPRSKIDNIKITFEDE